MCDFRALDAYMQELVDRGLPCAAVCVKKGHKVMHRASFGYSDAEGKRPMRGDELFFLYSCTKPVTITAAMQLVEKGLLDLDAPVSEYIPEYAHLTVQKGEEGVPASKVMRVRHLCTMSAGFDYNRERPAVQAMLAKGRNSALDVARALAKDPLLFEPGAKYEYSLCHDVLGGVIEAITGKSLEAYMQENIFKPLGMQHTTFDWRVMNEQDSAAQYRYEKETKQIVPTALVCTAAQMGLGHCSGGGGLISTLDDYSLLLDALACGGVSAEGVRVLSRESIDLIRTEQLTGLLDDPSFHYRSDPGYGYGLGMRTLLAQNAGQRSAVGEFGWDGAAGAFSLMDPTNEVSISFVAHVLRWVVPFGDMHLPLRDIAYQCMGL